MLALPKRLRYFLHRDAAHAGAVLRIFLRAVETTLRNACLHAPPKARFGAVSFIHRAGSTFNEHLHYHCVITDGVFAPDAQGEAEFFEAATMGEALLDHLTEKLRRRILRYMVRRNLIDEQVALDMAGWDHHGGFSLDASVRVEQWDRMALERLARYCARPPFAEGRLFLPEPDTVVYTLTKPDPQGRSALYLTPLQLLERLAALIPPPRVHRHRYAGVLAPNSPLRSQVVASAAPAAVLADKLAEAARKMDFHNDGGYDHQGEENVDKQARPPEPADPHGRDPEPAFPSRASRLSWAMLLARIYEILPLLCPRCSHPMDILSFITQPVLIDRILTHLDEPVEPPPVAPARDVPLCLLSTNRGRGPPVQITETPIQDSDW
ncbi:transposase [Acidobacteriota bacterium]